MTFKPRSIFEVHLSVADRHQSAEFYQRIFGFKLATDITSRDVIFLWMGDRGSGMLGLWGPACPNPPITRGPSHFAMHLPYEELVESPRRLSEQGITPLDFEKNLTDEPIVLSWMPALSVYFNDPDQHSLEFICMLDDAPAPELGIIKLSEWKKRRPEGLSASSKKENCLRRATLEV